MSDDTKTWRLTDPQGQEVDTSSVPKHLAQAIYYEIHKKTETIGRAYRKAKIITKEDVCRLFEKVQEHIRLTNVIGLSLEAHIEFDGGENLNLTSLSKFRNENIHEKTVKTNSFEIILHMSISIPEYAEYQPYKISLSGHNFSAESSAMAQIFGSIFAPPPIFVKIDYVQQSTAAAFKAIVDEWVESLKSSKRSAVLDFTLKNKNVWPKLFRALGLIVGSSAALALVARVEIADFNQLAFYLISSLLLAYFTFSAFNFCGKEMRNISENYEEASFIVFTAKDASDLEVRNGSFGTRYLKGLGILFLAFAAIGLAVVSDFVSTLLFRVIIN